MFRNRILAVAVAFAALAPSSALAELAGLLDSCTLELTVQQESCTVVHFHRCTADPAGYQRVLNSDRNGPETLMIHDAEGRWIELHRLREDEITRPVDLTEDHFSLTALREKYRDDWNFRMTNGGIGWGAVSRYEGTITVLDKSVLIDGVPLTVAEMQATQWFEPSAGSPPVVITGQQYVDLEDGRILGYRDTITLRGNVVGTKNRFPVAIALPGSPGSGDSTPRFGCDAPLS